MSDLKLGGFELTPNEAIQLFAIANDPRVSSNLNGLTLPADDGEVLIRYREDEGLTLIRRVNELASGDQHTTQAVFTTDSKTWVFDRGINSVIPPNSHMPQNLSRVTADDVSGVIAKAFDLMRAKDKAD